MSNIGYEIGRTTIKRILSDHGTEPAPERGKYTRWSTFLKSHWRDKLHRMPKDSVSHKLTAILYADVAGYSWLTGDDELGTHRRVMSALDFATESIKSGGAACSAMLAMPCSPSFPVS